MGYTPAQRAKFVDAAKAFGSDITIECGDKSANGKSIMDLLMLGAPVHTEILLHIDGDDEEQAADALSALVCAGFYELED